MYINFNIYKKHNLTPEYLIQLLAVKQKQTEEINIDVLGRFEELGYISYTKGKKNQDIRELVRLSDKGKKLLTDLSFEGAVDEESEKIRDWVVSVYKNKNGGIVKNKTELGRRIHWFKTITDIRGNFLAVLIQCVMQDTYDPECGQSFYDAKKDNSRLILSNLAENLFWMPQSHFDRHYTLDKSPLFTYFEDNQDYIKQVWNQLLNEDGSRK
jgi:DNA-binding MarR family transcriptional regulator